MDLVISGAPVVVLVAAWSAIGWAWEQTDGALVGAILRAALARLIIIIRRTDVG